FSEFALPPFPPAASVNPCAGDLHRFPIFDSFLGERAGKRQQHTDANWLLGRRMAGGEKGQTRCNETCPETLPVTHIHSSLIDRSFTPVTTLATGAPCSNRI